MYYLPNALGQPTQAGTFATGVQYYPNGAIKRFTYGNGLVHTMAQNARQLPERSTDSGGVLDLGYAYDRNGNVSAITDFTVAGRQSRSMGYDARDRLTSASSLLYPGGATYTYDVLDNVTRATVAGRDHVYWYDANNRLTNVLNGPGGASIIGLGYDARGNVNNKNGNLFVFDYGNRLRTAGSGGLLYEMYSLDGKLLWQRDEQLGLRFQHIYLGGSLVASRRMPIGETVYGTIYRHTDALGSPIAATDELGNTLQTTEHEPYGKMLNRTNDNRPGYTGHMMDKATGLVYMQQRYYDPLIPRFLSVDPITAYSNPVGAFNRYRYANNNPYRFTDPDGRQSRENAQVASTGVPLFDWILSPSDARSSHSQMVKEQLTAELSQPHSVKDIALYIAVAASLGTGAAGGGGL
ncbi:RHS repeat-associated core domain-containing protein [Stenotrophomonas acidaminiphila]|uniref:RHS repeat-associated core domain-containing protein n=1 Tax=Stenotrophomonas acidaminiphila TaxID=128780 RepID=UPI0039BC8923